MNPPSESSLPASVPDNQPKSQEGRLEARSPLQTTGLIAGVIGATAIVFALVLYAIDPNVLPLAVANAVFGAAGVVLYAVTNRHRAVQSLAGRSTAFIALEGLIVAGGLAAVGVVNYFAAQSPKEWDLTRDGLYTLHEQSIQVTRSLEQDVLVYGFFRPSEAARSVISQTVDLYRQHSSRIRLEFVNPDNPPRDLIEKFDLNSQSPRIVITAENGQFAKIRTPTEERMTNALIKVAQRQARKVLFLTGHGEPSIDARLTDEGFAHAASGLRNEGFVVETLSLVDRANVPSDASMVVVAGAKSRLLSNEVEALKAYLDRGGRMMVLEEPGFDYGLERIYRPYGVDIGDDVIIDPNPANRARGFGPDTPVIRKFEAHPITSTLERSAAMFPRIRSVTTRQNLAQVSTATLIQTGPTAWGETLFRNVKGYQRDENDVPGPVPIAAAVTRDTATNRAKRDNEARLVVIGDFGFITNKFALMVGNRDLFLNAANWLAGDEDRITIRPRPRYGDRLPLTERQQYGIMFFSVNLLPLLIIGIGFSVWAIRQRQ